MRPQYLPKSPARKAWEAHGCAFIVFVFRAEPVAYGSSQAGGRIEAVASSLCHSHSNIESKPHLYLHHSSQQGQILNPLSEARDRTHILVHTSRAHYHWATKGTGSSFKQQQRISAFQTLVENLSVISLLSDSYQMLTQVIYIYIFSGLHIMQLCLCLHFPEGYII